MSDLFLHWTLDNNSVCQSVPLSLINVTAYAAFHFLCAHVNARYGFKICSEGTGNNVSDEHRLLTYRCLTMMNFKDALSNH